MTRHHGDLRVESEPGNTRFQVRLPITAGEADSVVTPGAVPQGDAAPATTEES